MSDIAHSAPPSIAALVRAAARVLGALILLFWSYFIVAHLTGDEGRATRPLNTNDYVSLTTMVVSLAGICVAWKWEITGAVMTFIAVAIGAIANWRSLLFPGALIMAAACLFLLCGWVDRRRRRGQRRSPERSADSRPVPPSL